MPAQNTSARQPGLDLMRAIAILWVMLFHMRFVGLPATLQSPARYGWLGVNLFFVLSGYLIGSQLLRPYTRGEQPSIAGFYLRRAFRVLPAYLAVLALYFAVPGFREAPSLSPVWQFLTFTENFRIDYFHDQAFSHVWSLCVEEHFYLVLPLLVFVLMRRPGFGKALAGVFTILFLGLFVRGYVYHQLHPLLQTDPASFYTLYIEKIYYPTYTRLDGLLVGVILAAIQAFRPAWWQTLMARGNAVLIAGLGVCACALWLFRDRFAFSGTLVGFPVMALGLGLLVSASISPRCWLSRVRGFGFIATLAYSLYLTHKQIVHLDRLAFGPSLGPNTWTALLIYFVSSFLAATVLYFAIERPFLKMRERIRGQQRGVSSATA